MKRILATAIICMVCLSVLSAARSLSGSYVPTFAGANFVGLKESSQIVVPQGCWIDVKAYVTSAEAISGTLFVEIRKDYADWPDSQQAVLSKQVTLNAGGNWILMGRFQANELSEVSPFKFREYFVKAYWNGFDDQHKIYDPTQNPDTREWVKTLKWEDIASARAKAFSDLRDGWDEPGTRMLLDYMLGYFTGDIGNVLLGEFYDPVLEYVRPSGDLISEVIGKILDEYTPATKAWSESDANYASDLSFIYSKFFTGTSQPPSEREGYESEYLSMTSPKELVDQLSKTYAAEGYVMPSMYPSEDFITSELDFVRYLIQKEQDAWNQGNEQTAITYLQKEQLFAEGHLGWIPNMCGVANSQGKINTNNNYYDELQYTTGNVLITDKEFLDKVLVRFYTTKPLDMAIAMDRSGSMSWYGNLQHESSGTLSSDWTEIDTFSLASSVTSFDVVLETAVQDAEQYVRIKSPSGVWYGSDYTSRIYPSDYVHNTHVSLLGADYIGINERNSIELGIWEVYAKGSSNRNYNLAIAVSPTRIKAAKDAARYLVALMGENGQLGLVSFADSARLDKQMIQLSSSDNKKSFDSAIDSLTPLGGTAMGDGIATAIQELTSTRGRSNAERVMILFTDGVWNAGSDPIQMANEAKNTNIKIYCVGFGRVNHETLLQIAQITGGEYLYAPSTSDLMRIYQTMVVAAVGGSTISSTQGVAQEGESSQQRVAIDYTISEASFTIDWSGSTIGLSLVAPDGSIINKTTAPDGSNVTYSSATNYAIYKIRYPMPGTWTMTVTGIDVPSEGETYNIQVTGLATLTMNSSTDQDTYIYPQPVKITANLEDMGTPIIDAIVDAYVTLPSGSIANLRLFDDGLRIHGDNSSGDGTYTNYFTQFTSDGIYTIRTTATGTTVSGENFSRENIQTVLVSNVPPDVTSPTSDLSIGLPQYTSPGEERYVTSVTPISIDATDNVGVANTSYDISNETYSSGWEYSTIVNLTGLTDGTYWIKYGSTDLAGNVETNKTHTITLDNTPPTTNLTINNPQYVSDRLLITLDTALTLSADDAGSGINETFYRMGDGEWTRYAGPFKATTVGDYNITFYSLDMLGNLEPPRSVPCRIEASSNLILVAIAVTVVFCIMIPIVVAVKRRKSKV